jgi:hypothetical protein
VFEPSEQLLHWRDVLRTLQVPIAPYRGTPLPTGERCPLIGRGCGSVCRYRIGVTPDAGHYIERLGPDGRPHKYVIETAKGHIDGRCLTKAAALESGRRQSRV